MKAAAGAMTVLELKGALRRGCGEVFGWLISVVPAGPRGIESLDPMDCCVGCLAKVDCTHMEKLEDYCMAVV